MHLEDTRENVGIMLDGGEEMMNVALREREKENWSIVLT